MAGGEGRRSCNHDESLYRSTERERERMMRQMDNERNGAHALSRIHACVQKEQTDKIAGDERQASKITLSSLSLPRGDKPWLWGGNYS